MLVDARAGRFGGDAQGGHELAIVDLRVLGAEHRARELACEVWLPAPCFRRRDPMQRQAEVLLKHELMGEPGLIVRGQREEERALRPQLHIDARHVEQLGGESRPARLALAAERGQALFAGLRLRARRQHAGGCVACAGTGRASVEDQDGCAPLRQPPGDAKTDHPAADDGDAGVPGIGCGAVWQPAAPLAGMTQTGRSPLCNRKGLQSQTAPKAHIGALSVSKTLFRCDALDRRARHDRRLAAALVMICRRRSAQVWHARKECQCDEPRPGTQTS